MGARYRDVCLRCEIREVQNLEEAGSGRFGFVDAIRESRGRSGGRLGGGCFAESAVGECPGRQERGIVAGGQFGENVLGRIRVWTRGGQEVERRHWHAAIDMALNPWQHMCL